MPCGSLSLTSLPMATQSSLVQVVGSPGRHSELVEHRFLVDEAHGIGAHRDAVELVVDLAGGELVRVEVAELQLLAEKFVERGKLLATSIFEDVAIIHLDQVGQVAPGGLGRELLPVVVPGVGLGNHLGAGLLGVEVDHLVGAAVAIGIAPPDQANAVTSRREGADRGQHRGGRGTGEHAAEFAPGVTLRHAFPPRDWDAPTLVCGRGTRTVPSSRK